MAKIDHIFKESFGPDFEKKAVKQIYLSKDDIKRPIDQGFEIGIHAGFGMGRRMITPKDLQNRWDAPRYDINDCFDKTTNQIKYEIFSILSTGDLQIEAIS